MLDFSKGMEQWKKKNAESGGGDPQLSELLGLCTKDVLAALASNWELAGRSKLNKQELAARLADRMTDLPSLERALTMAQSHEWELFEKLVRTGSGTVKGLPPETLPYTAMLGIAIPVREGEGWEYVLPVEIRAAYQRLQQTGFVTKRERYRLVLEYMRAAANLYGACSIGTLIGIFNAQNKDKLDENELKAVGRFDPAQEDLFYLHDGYVLSEYFDSDNEDELWKLLEDIKHKPRYIPSKEEFLKYAEPDYFEPNAHLNRLRTYILNELCRDEELVDDLMEDIHLLFSMEEKMEAVLGEFERRGIPFMGERQINQLIPLLIQVHNNTRLWSHAGHTPAELSGSSRTSATAVSRPSNVVYLNQQASVSKVGRNDPCPCGSGKKHKKCCGSH